MDEDRGYPQQTEEMLAECETAIDEIVNNEVRGTSSDETPPNGEDGPGRQKNKIINKTVAWVLVFLLAGGGSLGFGIGAGLRFFESSKFNNVYYKEADTASAAIPVATTTGAQSIVKIAELVGPSVVPITSKVAVRDVFMNQGISEGAGSGVIFSIAKDAIYIITNNHVVENSTELTVGLTDDLTVKAQLVGVDSDTDLAVVKVNRDIVPADQLSKIKPATLGNSENLKVGEVAVAIGNPLGYSRTVTAGIISALDRRVDESLNRLAMIQTDAAINPGNSGGALVNGNGDVIGINTIKIADTNVEGIGFAIPINSAKPVIDQLLTKGFVSRPYLGIAGRNIDEDASKLYEIPVGVVVADVIQGSAAEAAGIKRGDVVINFDGKPITTMEQLIGLIAGKKVGDRVVVKLVRDGSQKIEVSVTLKDKNQN